MQNRRNYYRILHLQSDAPEAVVRSTYRTLMQKLRMHPDLGGDHWNAALLNEAFAVLSDPARRAAYDRECTLQPANARGAAARPDNSAIDNGTCPFCRAPAAPPLASFDASCAVCGSPMGEMRQPPPRRKDQRAIERLARREAVKYYTAWPDGGPFAGETRDLSLKGVHFAAATAIEPGTVVKLESRSMSSLVRALVCTPTSDRVLKWLVRAEYVAVRFRRVRGGFVSTRA